MGGFFGTISTKDCVNDLFYGTDYNSHLGTKRAGLVTYDEEKDSVVLSTRWSVIISVHVLRMNSTRSRENRVLVSSATRTRSR